MTPVGLRGPLKNNLPSKADQAVLAMGIFVPIPTFVSLIPSMPSLRVAFTLPGSIWEGTEHIQDAKNLIGSPFRIDDLFLVLLCGLLPLSIGAERPKRRAYF